MLGPEVERPAAGRWLAVSLVARAATMPEDPERSDVARIAGGGLGTGSRVVDEEAALVAGPPVIHPMEFQVGPAVRLSRRGERDGQRVGGEGGHLSSPWPARPNWSPPRTGSRAR